MHLGPLKDLYGPQKGSFWPQKALLGAPEVLGCLGGLDLVLTAAAWSNRIGHMVSALFWPPGVLKGPLLAQNVPFGGQN